MIAFLILGSFILTFISGVPGLFLRRGSGYSQRLATTLYLAGCVTGIASVVLVFLGASYDARFAWPIPGGALAVHVDFLSAFFLLPLFAVMGAGSLYGEGYWAESSHPENGRKLRFFYGALTAGFTLVLIAGDAWLFITGWEIVGLSAFFLVTTESSKEEALRAGWIYLIAAHVSTLLLLAMFALIRNATGTWILGEAISEYKWIPAILLLAVAAFGIKAGLMPFHVWLPEAHAAAPSHISAILSGVVLKIGVYGVVRVISWIPECPAWFGMVLLAAGIISGILGVIFALAQHDLKRLLAYHSIENIGIIFIGLGVAVLARGEVWGVPALAGALLHVWNHAFFKALLFFAAGSVLHHTGIRSLDSLGGLMREMKMTGVSFLIGAVAISGLPPLNGFVSEWLIYVAGFRAVMGNANAAIFAVPALALIGALAIACFVKAFSVVFLGNARSARAAVTHPEPLSMRAAMGFLVVICFAIGLWPLIVHGALSKTVSIVFTVDSSSGEIYNLLSVLPAGIFAALALIAFIALALLLLSRRRSKTVTWDCGYAAPTERMQYTASSFASPQVELFRWALRPDTHKPQKLPLFPDRASFESHVPDPVLHRFLFPVTASVRHLLSRARVIQTGHTQVYIVYVVATLLILLAWSAS